MREIVDGVVTWSWLSEPHGYGFNGYFVAIPRGTCASVRSSRRRVPICSRAGARASCSRTATPGGASWCAADRRDRVIHAADAAHAQEPSSPTSCVRASAWVRSSWCRSPASPRRGGVPLARAAPAFSGDVVIAARGWVGVLPDRVMDDPRSRDSVRQPRRARCRRPVDRRWHAHPARRASSARPGGDVPGVSRACRGILLPGFGLVLSKVVKLIWIAWDLPAIACPRASSRSGTWHRHFSAGSSSLAMTRQVLRLPLGLVVDRATREDQAQRRLPAHGDRELLAWW